MRIALLSATLLALPAAAQDASGSTTSSDLAPAEAAPPPAVPEAPAAPEAAAVADAEADAAGWGDFAAAPPKIFDARMYGYIDVVEEVAGMVPQRDGDDVSTGGVEYGFELPQLNVMVQGTIMERYRFFLNLAANKAADPIDDALLGVRNAWLEVPVLGDALQVRLGKTYRRFGLYNEILDATPTFIGIEPPELFDNDHLMLTRTTNFMLHGTLQPADIATVRWALTTGNDERDGLSIPIGADLRVELASMLTLGTSFYWTGGDAVPGRDLGDGSPRGGVVNWMEKDNYTVFGGFAQLQTSGLLVQAEGWVAPHSAVRNADAVLALADDNLNATQRARYFVNGDPSQGVTDVNVDYLVATAYGRIGYELNVGTVQVIPYGQFDWYSNPETIQEKDDGGDGDEAGLSDDGQFYKFTGGLVLRPAPPIALKIDGSAHVFSVNGAAAWYPEARVSFSYLWELPSVSMQ